MEEENPRDPTCPHCGQPVTPDGLCPSCALAAGAAWKPEVGGFAFEEEIGRGGMGVVWRARQLDPPRPVAVKLLRSLGPGVPLGDLTESETTVAGTRAGAALARFQRETAIAGRMEHPHIARVYTSGLASGMPYCVMEFVDGVPIDAFVASQDPRPSLRDILALFRDVCRAVQFAHDQAVIHRDLKPSNILVTADGTAKVLDFGLAKALVPDESLTPVQLTLDGQIAGTPRFMSPEQAGGEVRTLTVRTDVFSLGVILFKLLTGEYPHPAASTDLELIARVRDEDARRARSIDPAIPPEIDRLLAKALEREPGDRLPSAGEFAAEIERFLENRPLLSSGDSTAYRLRKWARRHRPLVTLGAAAAVALVAATTAYVVSLNAANTRIRESNEDLEQANEETSKARDLATRRARDVSLTTIDLAAQRGDWQTAVELLDQLVAEATDPSAPETLALRFKRLRALESWGQVDRLRAEVDALAAEAEDRDEFAGLALFWRAETAVDVPEDEVTELYRRAIEAGLPAAESHHAEAMVADSIPACRDALEAALAADPYHPKAFQMLAILEMATGHHDEARTRLTAGSLVFPEDGNYPLLLAVQAGLHGDGERLEAHLAEAEPLIDPETFAGIRPAIATTAEVFDAYPKLLLSEDANVAALPFKLMAMGGTLANLEIAIPPIVAEAVGETWRSMLAYVQSQDPAATTEQLRNSADRNPEGFTYLMLGGFINMIPHEGAFLPVDQAREMENALVRAMESPWTVPGARRVAPAYATIAAVSLMQHGDADAGDRLANYVNQLLDFEDPVPNTPIGMMVKGLIRAEQWSTARRLCDRIIGEQPSSRTRRQHRLAVERAAGNRPAITQAARDILALVPDDPAAREALAELGEPLEPPQPAG